MNNEEEFVICDAYRDGKCTSTNCEHREPHEYDESDCEPYHCGTIKMHVECVPWKEERDWDE